MIKRETFFPWVQKLPGLGGQKRAGWLVEKRSEKFPTLLNTDCAEKNVLYDPGKLYMLECPK